MNEFDGFPKQTLTFLRGLRRNNTKAWFEEHRGDYEQYWVDPAKAFVDSAGAGLQSIAPVAAEPRVNGSIFWINRDIRFSKDKTPYKDHLDFWFWEGSRKTAPSGFFLRISPDGPLSGLSRSRTHGRTIGGDSSSGRTNGQAKSPRTRRTGRGCRFHGC